MQGLKESKITSRKYQPTDEDLLKDEKAIAQTDPLFLIEGGFLIIKTKQAQLIRLQLNSIQKRIIHFLKSLLTLGNPIRIWLLKARQMGISTLLEAVIYAYTSQRENNNACVIADDLDGANYIFEMQKLFQEQMEINEPHLAPKIKHSNEKKLEFEEIHSQVLIDTSENKDAGRKYTFRFIHLSECAYFHSLKTLMLGLAQTVPTLPETIIFGETTANGLGGDFYTIWNEVEKLIKKNATEWIPLFLPWFLMEEYQLLLEKPYPIEGILFANNEEKLEFLNEEKRFQIEGIEYKYPEVKNRKIIWKKEIYKLTDVQLNWRRYIIVNQCNGDPLLFRQEYPSTPKEAFISSGDIYFDRRGLEKQEAKPPIAIGNLVEEAGQMVYRADPLGRFAFYKFPQPMSQYIIGADPAEGSIGPDGEPNDKCAGIVLNAFNNETVAIYNHLIDPDTFAYDLIKLGRFYHNALIACANKNYGAEVNRILFKNYGNIFKHIKEEKGIQKQTDQIGFNENSVTRPEMLAQMNAEIREGSTELIAEELINQCWKFIRNPKKDGKPEAHEGENDDLVIARAIAGKVRQLKPYLVTLHSQGIPTPARQTAVNAGLGFKGGK